MPNPRDDDDDARPAATPAEPEQEALRAEDGDEPTGGTGLLTGIAQA